MATQPVKTAKTTALTVSQKQVAKLEGQLLESAQEKIIEHGDYSPLTPPERRALLIKWAKKYKLDPTMKPFYFMKVDGRMIPYAGANAADGMAERSRLSQGPITHEVIGAAIIVKTCFMDQAYLKSGGKEGRCGWGTGAVDTSLRAKALENGIKKAETQARRRAILKLVAPSFLDESEIPDIPGAVVIDDYAVDEKRAASAKPAGASSTVQARKKLGR